MRVQGFTAAATAAGIKYANRADLGLIFSRVPAAAAGVFTTNRVKAAPVLLDRERMRAGRAQAILVNSGNANACTGEAGMRAAQACSALTAQALGIDEQLVQVASTGVIGQPLPLEPFEKAVPELVNNLGADRLCEVARAMMTTDLVEKTVSTQVSIKGVPVTLAAMAKGSGMIRPDMATMLCFILSDAKITAPVLSRLLHRAVDESFNTITVDGDTSTNDTAMVLANGLAGNCTSATRRATSCCGWCGRSSVCLKAPRAFAWCACFPSGDTGRPWMRPGASCGIPASCSRFHRWQALKPAAVPRGAFPWITVRNFRRPFRATCRICAPWMRSGSSAWIC